MRFYDARLGGNMKSLQPTDVDLGTTAGDPATIRALADRLRRQSARETLDAIQRHLRTYLYKPQSASWNHPLRRRLTSVEMLRQGAWGCSAHAQVACHLARACGIPAILAKAMKLEWIASGNRGDGRGAGHVYVEVLLEGERPALWEPEGGRVVERYDPVEELVPEELTPDGRQKIYGKGDPDHVVLSHHGTVWEEETKRLFPVG
jgi:transglutaminase-like putative cysteine protease